MRKLENQKEHIYKEAKEMILNKEVQNFSFRSLAKRCDIGMGSLYKYYGSKDDILIDITKELWLNYIKDISNETHSFRDFFVYLDFIYEKLIEYSEAFNYNILSKELSQSYYKEGGMHHRMAQTTFINLIDKNLNEYYQIDASKSMLISTFITHNLHALITNKGYEYYTFLEVVKDLLQTYKENK